MGLMTAQPPLPLIPAGAVPFGKVAALLQDDDGGPAFIRGNCDPLARQILVLDRECGSMLLWMSRPGEALLSGLSGGAQLAGDGGPGGVVLPGADHGGLQLFVGVDEEEARVSEQGDGVGFGDR
jgi:hypothetical protein